MKVMVNPSLGIGRVEVQVPNDNGEYETITTKFIGGEIIEVTEKTYESMENMTFDTDNSIATSTILKANSFNYTPKTVVTPCCTITVLRTNYFRRLK